MAVGPGQKLLSTSPFLGLSGKVGGTQTPCFPPVYFGVDLWSEGLSHLVGSELPSDPKAFKLSSPDLVSGMVVVTQQGFFPPLRAC